MVTYNPAHWLTPCFQSLRNSHYPVKTITIDDASEEDTVLDIKKNILLY